MKKKKQEYWERDDKSLEGERRADENYRAKERREEEDRKERQKNVHDVTGLQAKRRLENRMNEPAT